VPPGVVPMLTWFGKVSLGGIQSSSRYIYTYIYISLKENENGGAFALENGRFYIVASSGVNPIYIHI